MAEPYALNRSFRTFAVIPLLGAIFSLCSLLYLSQPTTWLNGATTDPAGLPFVLTVIGYLVLPHIGLAVAVYRSWSIGWFWWSAITAAVMTTVGQVFVDVTVLTGDDPQTPILLVLYLPIQLITVLAILTVGYLCGGVNRLTRRPEPAGHNA